MRGIGTIVNAGAVLAGSAVGLAGGRLIPERVRSTTMAAIGLAVFALGVQMAVDPRVDGAGPAWRPDPLVVIGGLVLGGILGELLRIELRLEQLGVRLRDWARGLPFARRPAGGDGRDLVEGFVTASVLYCVGVMGVLGPIQDAAGQPQLLFVKALLDGFIAIVLAATLGAGVALSALTVAVYQGSLTLAAGFVAPWLGPPVLATLTAAGGVLVAAVGLDVAGIKRLPVGNLLPGAFVAAAIAGLVG
jgi:uncharacterized membrane protein YqgA involved in biofilm formation